MSDDTRAIWAVDYTPMVPRIVMLAGVCVVVAALWAAQAVLVPLALAILLTFLLAPLVRRVENLYVPRIPAVLVVVLLAFGLLGGIGWLVTGQLLELANDLPVYKENITSKLRALPGGGGGVFDRARGTIDEITEELKTPTTTPATTRAAASEDDGGIDRLALLRPDGLTQAFDRALREGEPVPVEVVQPQQTPLQMLGDTLMALAEPLATAGIVIVLVIFMLLQREDLRDRIIRLLGGGRLQVTTSALDDAAKRISRYLGAQATVNGTYGVAVAVGLWVIGLIFAPETGFPNWALWGLLAGLIRFIPYIGPWIGASFPILLSALVFEGIAPLLVTTGYFVVIELWSNNLMEPWLYGASTGLSATAVIVSAVFWTWLWGPIGLILATPLTTCLVVLGKHVAPLKFLDILLGDAPVLDPPVRVYQRLLAMDQEEAAELVEEFGEEMSLDKLFDTILLPVLAIARSDRHANQLDDKRHQTILAAIHEMIEEANDAERTRRVQEQARQAVEMARGDRSAPAESTFEPVRVFCLPAGDYADELAGNMLQHLLNQRGYDAITLSADNLASQKLQQVKEDQPGIVVISALPPSAITRARYLCKRLAAKTSNQRLIVGLWTAKANLKQARERLAGTASPQVVATLGDAITLLRQVTPQPGRTASVDQ